MKWVLIKHSGNKTEPVRTREQLQLRGKQSGEVDQGVSEHLMRKRGSSHIKPLPPLKVTLIKESIKSFNSKVQFWTGSWVQET